MRSKAKQEAQRREAKLHTATKHTKRTAKCKNRLCSHKKRKKEASKPKAVILLLLFSPFSECVLCSEECVYVEEVSEMCAHTMRVRAYVQLTTTTRVFC